MAKRKRIQLFVDPQVQRALLLRCVINWGFCLITAVMMLLCWSVISEPGNPTLTYFADMWFTYCRAFVVSFFLLLIVMIDFVRLSNKFCGPLMRLRASMRRVASGESVAEIRFRDGDSWHDFATEFNSMLACVHPEALDATKEAKQSLFQTDTETTRA